MKELTPYQKSLLVKKPATSVWQAPIFAWLWSSIPAILSLGFWYLMMNGLPGYVEGIMLFLTVTYILLNWIGVVGLLLARLIIWVSKVGITITKESPEITDTKFKFETRKVIMSFASCYNISPVGILKIYDIIADTAFFATLVISIHPVLALFHCLSVVFLFLLISSCKKAIYEVVSNLEDPLESEKEEHIDDLMDKLCQPPDKE